MLRLIEAAAIALAPTLAHAEMWSVSGRGSMKSYHKVGSGRVCYVHRLSNAVTRHCYGGRRR